MKSRIIQKRDEPNNSKFLSQYYLIQKLFNKMKHSNLFINRLDYFGNPIPLGAFCYAISFVLYGFCECKVFKRVDTFTFSVLLLFGGIGQVTAGIMEFIKSRTFPTAVYFVYGLYFISFYYFYNFKGTDQILFFQEYIKIFYGTWAGLSFPLIFGSLRSNLIYCLQNGTVCIFFIIKCIGECKNWNVLRTYVSGILEIITGLLSLYICFSQILNKHFSRNLLPTIPLKKDNEIDDFKH